jgi:CheY-like chemotaxis protein
MLAANKVLIVDDDAPTCELISEVLSAADIETYRVTDSNAAGLRVFQQKFDAVFLDARMPPPDGIELARRIRGSGINKKSLIVMITGEKEQMLLTRAFEAGVNFVLFKPVDRHSLLRLLRVTQAPIDRERRRFTRVPVQCRVSMEFGIESALGATLDLSMCGLLVQSNRRFPIGSLLRVNLDLESGKSILNCYARVVRLVGHDAMGLELESVSLSDTHLLEEFLLQRIMQSDGNAKAS